MIRSLIWGAVFFGAGYLAATQLPNLKKDLEHYNRLREMSDQPPLLGSLSGQISNVMGMAGNLLGGATSGDGKNPLMSILGMIPGIGADVERSARIRSM